MGNKKFTKFTTILLSTFMIIGILVVSPIIAKADNSYTTLGVTSVSAINYNNFKVVFKQPLIDTSKFKYTLTAPDPVILKISWNTTNTEALLTCSSSLSPGDYKFKIFYDTSNIGEFNVSIHVGEFNKPSNPINLNGWQRNSSTLNYDVTWSYYTNGVMKTGWLLDGGKWYYLKFNGDMATDWVLDNGKWYYFNINGVMATGWTQSGEWYYLNNDGTMKTGWLNYNSKWYYLNADGGMVVYSWFGYNGKSYYFNIDGTMAVSTTTVDGYVVGSDGSWNGKSPIVKEGVRIGMTQQQVLDSSWGEPKRINRSTGSYGVHEQWVYGGRNYLYFQNGILTSFQN